MRLRRRRRCGGGPPRPVLRAASPSLVVVGKLRCHAQWGQRARRRAGRHASTHQAQARLPCTPASSCRQKPRLRPASAPTPADSSPSCRLHARSHLAQEHRQQRLHQRAQHGVARCLQARGFRTGGRGGQGLACQPERGAAKGRLHGRRGRGSHTPRCHAAGPAGPAGQLSSVACSRDGSSFGWQGAGVQRGPPAAWGAGLPGKAPPPRSTRSPLPARGFAPAGCWPQGAAPQGPPPQQRRRRARPAGPRRPYRRPGCRRWRRAVDARTQRCGSAAQTAGPVQGSAPSRCL